MAFMGLGMTQNSLFTSNSKFILYLKRIISILFILGTSGLLFYGYCITANNQRVFDYFYNYTKECQDIDVLVVGSSHAYCSIIPDVLQDEYGYSSYVLGSGRLSTWYGYYYLVEALKYAKPKLVVFDCYTSVYEPEAFPVDKYPMMNLVGMRPSINKMNAVRSWEPDDPVDIFLNFPIMHTRYDEIDEDSFSHHGENRGFEGKEGVKPCDMTVIEGTITITDTEEIFDRSEWAIRSAINLCKDNNIEIVLINATTPSNTDHQSRYNYVSEIASEYEVPFLNGNLNYKEIGIDGKSDFADAGHLNVSGAQKYTIWLGKYVKEHGLVH